MLMVLGTSDSSLRNSSKDSPRGRRVHSRNSFNNNIPHPERLSIFDVRDRTSWATGLGRPVAGVVEEFPTFPSLGWPNTDRLAFLPRISRPRGKIPSPPSLRIDRYPHTLYNSAVTDFNMAHSLMCLFMSVLLVVATLKQDHKIKYIIASRQIGYRIFYLFINPPTHPHKTSIHILFWKFYLINIYCVTFQKSIIQYLQKNNRGYITIVDSHFGQVLKFNIAD